MTKEQEMNVIASQIENIQESNSNLLGIIARLIHMRARVFGEDTLPDKVSDEDYISAQYNEGYADKLSNATGDLYNFTAQITCLVNNLEDFL